jgi:hypothetical protein
MSCIGAIIMIISLSTVILLCCSPLICRWCDRVKAAERAKAAQLLRAASPRAVADGTTAAGGLRGGEQTGGSRGDAGGDGRTRGIVHRMTSTRSGGRSISAAPEYR